MLSLFLRRLLAAIPAFLAFAAGLFLLVATAPPPAGASEEDLARRFAGLPLAFNVDPSDRTRIVPKLVERLCSSTGEDAEDGEARSRDVQRLLSIGAAGLPDLVPPLERAPRGARVRLARELAPLAFRMGIEGVTGITGTTGTATTARTAGIAGAGDLDDPEKADYFWARVLQLRAPDLLPASIRRTLRRFLTERSEPLYARQLSVADTAALAPIMDALDDRSQDLSGSRRDIEALAIAAASRVGARVDDVASLKTWWTIHRSDYVELDPLERIVARVTETRLGHWVAFAVARGFGRSWRDDAPVIDDLLRRGPTTVARAVSALLLACFVALPIGALAAAGRGRVIDRVSGSVLLWLYALPPFVIALVARAGLHAQGGAATVAALVALFVTALAPLARQTRAKALEVLSQDFVQVARSKGVGPLGLWTRHIARNVIGNVLAVAVAQLPVTLAAAVVVESILDLDGLGPSLLSAVRAHDTPWLAAFALLGCAGTLTVIVASDVVHAALDRRVQRTISLAREGA